MSDSQRYHLTWSIWITINKISSKLVLKFLFLKHKCTSQFYRDILNITRKTKFSPIGWHFFQDYVKKFILKLSRILIILSNTKTKLTRDVKIQLHWECTNSTLPCICTKIYLRSTTIENNQMYCQKNKDILFTLE